jgi:hypothetical protein
MPPSMNQPGDVLVAADATDGCWAWSFFLTFACAIQPGLTQFNRTRGPRLTRADFLEYSEAMLALEDCIALCDLTEEEVLAIAQHEHIPEIAAAEMASYLVRRPDGEMTIKSMIRDDIREAEARGERGRTLSLKLVLRNFVLQHPRCEERHRELLHASERRSP